MPRDTPVLPRRSLDGFKKRRLNVDSSPTGDFALAAEQLTKDDSIPLHVRTILAVLLDTRAELDAVNKRNAELSSEIEKMALELKALRDENVSLRRALEDQRGRIESDKKLEVPPEIPTTNGPSNKTSESICESIERRRNIGDLLYLIQRNYDLVVLSETWLSETISSESLFDATVRADEAGGVLSLLKSIYGPSLIFKESVCDAYELLAVDLDIAYTTLRVVAVYKAPSCSSTAFTQLLKAITDLVAHNISSLVLGDFNIPEITWRDICTGPPMGFSDHSSISFRLRLRPKPDLPSKLRRDFSSANFDSILQYLSGIDWYGSLNSARSVNDKYELFLTILHHTIELFVPLKPAKSKGTLRLPSYLERLSKRKNDAWNIAIGGDDVNAWDNYRKLRRLLDKKLKKFWSRVERKV
ncbi:hypothetical protein COOONC_21686, partial [Cooperia oncophora]